MSILAFVYQTQAFEQLTLPLFMHIGRALQQDAYIAQTTAYACLGQRKIEYMAMPSEKMRNYQYHKSLMKTVYPNEYVLHYTG
jgi:hypothetical protein